MTVIRAGGKINLGLRITGVLPDGYHELATVFYPFTHPFDQILIKCHSADFRIECDDARISGVNNILARTWEAFSEKTGSCINIHITLRKGIPIGAGLGGGSSDAAALLQWLNKTAQFPLERQELFALAKSLGADVPFFLYGLPCVARGVGEELRPIKLLASHNCLVLVCPPLEIGTSWAFKAYDALHKNTLTKKETGTTDFSLCLSQEINVLELDLSNDLEEPVFAKYGELGEIKRLLLKAGAVKAAMSGSGSSIYGLFDHNSLARNAFRKLKNLYERVYFLPLDNCL